MPQIPMAVKNNIEAGGYHSIPHWATEPGWVGNVGLSLILDMALVGDKSEGLDEGCGEKPS